MKKLMLSLVATCCFLLNATMAQTLSKGCENPENMQTAISVNNKGAGITNTNRGDKQVAEMTELYQLNSVQQQSIEMFTESYVKDLDAVRDNATMAFDQKRAAAAALRQTYMEACKGVLNAEQSALFEEKNGAVLGVKSAAGK